MEEVDLDKLEEAAKAFLVQKDQRQKTERVITQAVEGLERLNSLNTSNNDLLDSLFQQAESMCETMGLNSSDLSEEDYDSGNRLTDLTEEERDRITIPCFDVVDVIDADASWDEYMNSLQQYADNNGVDLMLNPFETMLTDVEKNELGQQIRDDYLMQKAHCDKYDYIIAAVCGVFCGVIDSLFVGMPKESKLGNWTDEKANNFVEKVSKGLWKGDSKKRNGILEQYANKTITKEQRDRLLKEAGIPYNQNLTKEPDGLQSCIQYLEKKFGVNYDASSAKYLEGDDILKGMRPGNHHIMSLAHSPSVIGLIFSILDQFTGRASFVDSGKLIRPYPVKKRNGIDEFELRGNTFPTKLICGIANWIGHMCSDLVGANTTRAKENSRGSGLPVPFMELLQFCTFEVPDGKGKRISISELTIKIFENGYDVRFAAATAIPVILNEFMIRLFWSLKSRFYHKNTWEESIPFGNRPELRRMLLVGHGTLCSVDLVDAGVRSASKGFELLTFMLHLNVVAWGRLAISGLQEVRALYKENVVDIEAMDADLEVEWNKLYLGVV